MKNSSESALRKVKNFVANNYKNFGKILLFVAVLIAFSVAAMLLLSAFDVVYYDEGVHINEHLFDKFLNAWYSWIIIIAVQVGVTTLLCFVPGASMAFIMLLGTIYKSSQTTAFLMAFSGVMLSSLLMYLVGRIGGYPICVKLLGKEDCRKASRLLNNRGVVFFPIMMLFPVFPDDALVMIAGTLRMSLKWFIPSIVVCRGIGVATIVFGVSNIPFDKFTTPWHWIIFISVCVAGIALVFWAANRLSIYLEKRSSRSKSVAALSAPPRVEQLTACEPIATESEKEAPEAEESAEAQTDEVVTSDEETTV